MQTPPSKERSVLNATVLRLGFISFLGDVSSEMLYPIAPIFLTTVLGASMASVGVIEGFAEAVSGILKTYSGQWSDRIGRRTPFIWIGYLFAASAKPLTGFASTWIHVLGTRALDRVGKGLRTSPRDALLSESVAPDLRGAAFGWHRLMDTLGAAIGPLVAVWILSSRSDATALRHLYFWAFIPGLLSVAIALTIREPKHLAPAVSARSQFRLKHLGPRFKRFVLSWTLFSLANSSDAFLILGARHAGISLTMTILMYCFYNLLYALLSPALGTLSDRIGRRRVLMLGLGIFAFVYIGFALNLPVLFYWLLFGLYGIYMAATEGVAKALAIDLVPEHLRATGVGVLGTVTGLSTIFASTFSGFLWDRIGPSAAFFYGAMGALMALISLSRTHFSAGTTDA